MPQGGQTTVIQRILERRAQRLAVSHEETTASIGVMLRVVPPPKAMLMCERAAPHCRSHARLRICRR